MTLQRMTVSYGLYLFLPVESTSISRSGPPQLQSNSSSPENLLWEFLECRMLETPYHGCNRNNSAPFGFHRSNANPQLHLWNAASAKQFVFYRDDLTSWLITLVGVGQESGGSDKEIEGPCSPESLRGNDSANTGTAVDAVQYVQYSNCCSSAERTVRKRAWRRRSEKTSEQLRLSPIHFPVLAGK